MSEKQDTVALICSRDTLDGAYPALILAINARRLGQRAKIFFTFMGLNLLKKGGMKKPRFYMPGFLGAIPGMPFLATWMMKRMIDKAGIPDLETTLEMARAEGVEFVACKMTVDMMELTPDDLIEDATIEPAETFLKYALDTRLHLFT